MKLHPEYVYHVYNRGNNGQKIFFTNENYDFFLSKLKRSLTPKCDIIAYCLMPNHFHLMISTSRSFNADEFYNTYKTLLSSYTRAINKQENRKGSLIQQNSKSKLVSDWHTFDYAFPCLIYIHQNPQKAGLVKQIQDWKYSSFIEYLGLKNDSICNFKVASQFFDFPKSKTDFIAISKQTINPHLLVKLL